MYMYKNGLCVRPALNYVVYISASYPVVFPRLDINLVIWMPFLSTATSDDTGL